MENMSSIGEGGWVSYHWPGMPQTHLGLLINGPVQLIEMHVLCEQISFILLVQSGRRCDVGSIQIAAGFERNNKWGSLLTK